MRHWIGLHENFRFDLGFNLRDGWTSKKMDWKYEIEVKWQQLQRTKRLELQLN